MNKVNNKKAVRNLAFKSFLANKTRNIVAITAIALTTLLFTAVFTVGAVMMHSLEQSNFRQVGGYAHGSVKDVSYADIEVLKNHELIKEYGVSRTIGTLTEGVFAKNPAEIKYVDANYAKLSYADLIKGEMPKENTNEIICDTNVFKTLGIEPAVGSEITLTYNFDDKQVTDTFIVSGFFEPNEVISVGFIYTARSYADNLVLEYQKQGSFSVFGRIDMSILLQNDKSIEGDIVTIIKESGYQTENSSSEKYVGYGVNWGYASAQAAATADISTILFASLLILLFMLSGYLIIFNIFKISVSNDIRFYGLLKTVGTTKRQIKNIITIQAVLLSSIGIPFGLILGYFCGCFISPSIVGSLNTQVVELTINPLIFIGGAMFAFVTVMISCTKPATIAGGVSPVEAVKYTEANIKMKKGHKSHKFTPFNMAIANMKRSKVKTVIVVTSLSLAILILQMTVMFTNGFSMEKYLKYFSASDFLVGNAKYLNSSEIFSDDISLSDEDVFALSSIVGEENYGVIYGKLYNTFVFSDVSRLENYLSIHEGYAAEDTINSIKEYILKRGTNDDGQVLMEDTFYLMDEYAMGKLNVIEGDIQNLKENEIIAVYKTDDYDMPVLQSNSKKIGDTIIVRDTSKEKEYFDVKTDKVITDIENFDGDFYEKPAKYIDKEYTVVAIATIPRSLSYRRYSMGEEIFVLPSKYMAQNTIDFAPLNMIIDVEKDKVLSVENALNDYTTNINPKLGFDSQDKMSQQFYSLKNMFTMVGGFLSVVVGFIGMLNFFNVVLTSINTRKREFAMLQSIGMTNSQLKKMLVIESLIYILFTVFISALLTVLTTPMLNTALSALWFYESKITFAPIVCITPVLILIGILVPSLLYKTINNKSIVERLREAI